GCTDFGADLSKQEMDAIFDKVDKDGSGSLDFDEFLAALRPPMSNARRELITKAFKKLDKTCDGVITVEDLKGVYNCKHHPKFRNGEWTEDDVFKEFAAHLRGEGNVDGTITKDEFMNYYSGVSASVDNDAYFALIMKTAYVRLLLAGHLGVQRVAADKHADAAAQHANGDDEGVEQPGVQRAGVPLQHQVEVGGPHEGQHGAGEAADQAAQQGEVRHGDGHHKGEQHQQGPRQHRPALELPLLVPAAGQRPAREEAVFQEIGSCEVGQRVREERLQRQRDVHRHPQRHSGTFVRLLVISSFVLSAKPNRALKMADSRCVQFIMQAKRRLSIRLPSSVGRKMCDVWPHLGGLPVGGAGEAVDDDDAVDDDVGDGVPEGDEAHVPQRGERGARQQADEADADPEGLAEPGPWEAEVHQVTAQHQVENAGHQRLRDGRRVHHLAAQLAAEYELGDLPVASAHADAVLVQAVHQHAARVAADEGHEDDAQHRPIPEGPACPIRHRPRRHPPSISPRSAAPDRLAAGRAPGAAQISTADGCEGDQIWRTGEMRQRRSEANARGIKRGSNKGSAGLHSGSSPTVDRAVVGLLHEAVKSLQAVRRAAAAADTAAAASAAVLRQLRPGQESPQTLLRHRLSEFPPDTWPGRILIRMMPDCLEAAGFDGPDGRPVDAEAGAAAGKLEHPQLHVGLPTIEVHEADLDAVGLVRHALVGAVVRLQQAGTRLALPAWSQVHRVTVALPGPGSRRDSAPPSRRWCASSGQRWVTSSSGLSVGWASAAVSRSRRQQQTRLNEDEARSESDILPRNFKSSKFNDGPTNSSESLRCPRCEDDLVLARCVHQPGRAHFDVFEAWKMPDRKRNSSWRARLSPRQARFPMEKGTRNSLVSYSPLEFDERSGRNCSGWSHSSGSWCTPYRFTMIRAVTSPPPQTRAVTARLQHTNQSGHSPHTQTRVVTARHTTRASQPATQTSGHSRHTTNQSGQQPATTPNQSGQRSQPATPPTRAVTAAHSKPSVTRKQPRSQPHHKPSGHNPPQTLNLMSRVHRWPTEKGASVEYALHLIDEGHDGQAAVACGGLHFSGDAVLALRVQAAYSRAQRMVLEVVSVPAMNSSVRINQAGHSPSALSSAAAAPAEGIQEVGGSLTSARLRRCLSIWSRQNRCVTSIFLLNTKTSTPMSCSSRNEAGDAVQPRKGRRDEAANVVALQILLGGQHEVREALVLRAGPVVEEQHADDVGDGPRHELVGLPASVRLRVQRLLAARRARRGWPPQCRCGRSRVPQHFEREAAVLAPELPLGRHDALAVGHAEDEGRVDPAGEHLGPLRACQGLLDDRVAVQDDEPARAEGEADKVARTGGAICCGATRKVEQVAEQRPGPRAGRRAWALAAAEQQVGSGGGGGQGGGCHQRCRWR
uniref:Calcyphosin-like protein n=1 Tax=Macrostomum lignano TaxID=282301 RepID=A0A1I8IW38_9PLAT